MPSPSWDDSIRLRMNRAQEHATELDSAVADFLKGDPYEIVREFDLQPGNHVPPMVTNGAHLYRVRVREPVPDRICALANDIMQAMRASLDYLTWQLGLAQSDTPPPTTAFPIFRSRELYERDRLRFIGGIDAATHPIFDEIQPFRAGDRADVHPLWVLHRLAKDYEHRMPPVVGSLPRQVGVVNAPEGVGLFVGGTVGAFDDGDVVGAVGIIDGADPETKLDARFAFGVAFGKDTPAQSMIPLRAEIDRIGVEVDRVIGKFAQFF
jgi:hypothetical protein